jgi:hypothetical protein
MRETCPQADGDSPRQTRVFARTLTANERAAADNICRNCTRTERRRHETADLWVSSGGRRALGRRTRLWPLSTRAASTAVHGKTLGDDRDGAQRDVGNVTRVPEMRARRTPRSLIRLGKRISDSLVELIQRQVGHGANPRASLVHAGEKFRGS